MDWLHASLIAIAFAPRSLFRKAAALPGRFRATLGEQAHTANATMVRCARWAERKMSTPEPDVTTTRALGAGAVHYLALGR
jgi:hypothetical protein